MAAEAAKRVNDTLKGMKEIREVLNGISEATVLQWHAQDGLPIVKKRGIWLGSRKNIEKWWAEFAQ